MNPSIAESWLLASGLSRSERLQAIGNELNAGATANELLWFIVSAIALLALLLFVRKIYVKPEIKVERRGPDLFDRAIRELDLSKEDRELLTQVARAARLSDPVAVLLSPANLAHALERMPSDNNDSSSLRRQVNSVCLRLFERPLTTRREG